MSEYGNAIREMQSAAPAAAIGTIDANPDDAARALQLEKASGTPASAIYGDIEGFEAQHKATLAGNIVAGNPQLQDYINNHPLAAPLSADDYGNLDEASQAANRLKRMFVAQNPIGFALTVVPDAALEAWHKMEEAAAQPGGQWYKEGDAQKYPGIVATVGIVEDFVRALSVGMAGVTGATKGAAKSLYESATGDPAGAERFGRDIGGMAEMMLQGGGPHGIHNVTPKAMESHIMSSPVASLSPKQMEAFIAAKPWLDTGVEPPRGLHSEIDKIKADRNKIDLDELDDNLKVAQASGTRERAPDMYAGFMRQHIGEAKIGISGERIAELYGEKIPAVDDNLLGWVPGIKEQLEAARETGQDIQIPLADWLAKVDPAIAKELHDDTRVRPGNITKAEAEAAKAEKSKAADEVFTIEDPLAARADGEVWTVRVIRNKETGEIDALYTNELGVTNVALRDRATSPEEAIAQTFGGHPQGTTPDLARVKRAETAPAHEPTPIESPLAQVRGASALEPAFSIGDRKLSLERLKNEPDVRAPEEVAKSEGKDWQTLSEIERNNYRVRTLTSTQPGHFGPEQGFHDFKLVDETGRDVGTINLSAQKGGKQLYIEMINGINGLGPRDFGPSLMRDLLRQLKAEFPEAETITGHRVSGARDKAGTFDRPSAQPVVKLDIDTPAGWDKVDANFRELMNEAWTRSIGDLWKAEVKPTELYTKHEAELAKAVEAELKRIVPTARTQAVTDITDTKTETKSPRGAWVQFREQNPVIIYKLMDSAVTTMGVGRHEAIHHLRQYGFFTEAEWKTLSDAVKSEGWIEKHNIESRYEGARPELKTEEAIAEGFRDWAKSKDNLANRAKQLVGIESPLDKIFRKLQNFLDAIGKKFKEILGHEPTWEELFESAFKGEIGSREGGKPLNPEAFRLSIEDRADMLRANATGLDLVSFKRLQKLIEARHEQDYAAAMKRAEREQRKRQSDEWKTKSAAIRPQVVEDIKQRPDVAADLFLTNGEFLGQKLGEGFHIRTEDVVSAIEQDTGGDYKGRMAEWRAKKTEIEERGQAASHSTAKVLAEEQVGLTNKFDAYKTERFKEAQKAQDLIKDEWYKHVDAEPQWEATKPQGIPEEQAKLLRAYLRKDGLPADEVANMFGFKSREELFQSLGEYNLARKETGKNPDLYRRQLIDEEVTRRMERDEGFLEKNILEEARDQALSQTQLDLLAEEMHAAGMMAKVATIDKNVAKAWVEDAFSKLRVGDVSSDHFMTQIGKWGREAERALIAGKPAEAIQFMQKKYLNALMAKQAKDLETSVDQLARQSKKYLRQDVKGVDLPFVDHIQQLLAQAGYKVRKSPEDIQRGLEFHGQEALPDLVRSTQDLGWEPVVSDGLQARGAKGLDSMTTAEFGEFKDAITSLDWIGRQINKIEIAGEKADFAEFRSNVLDHIKQLPARPRDSQDRWVYNIDASLTRMEEMVKDLDLREELGPLWRAVIEPTMKSKAKEYDLQTALSEHFVATKGAFDKKWRKSLGDSVPQDIIWDPYTQTPFDMTRENLLQVMLNWGNRSNIEKYVAGAGWARWGVRLTKEQMAVYEGQIKALIDKHATKEDWDFVQRMWEPFKGWQKDMDIVARNTSGVAPKWIEPTAVDTPHGTFDGGYWPVKYDRLGSNIKAIEESPGKESEGVFGKNYFRAATSKGYLKERTGYVDFVDISTSIEQAVGTMQQTIHDIAFRDSLIQSSKVFYDPQIRAAIRKHYGAEYEAQLVPWLKRIAYQFSTDDSSVRGYNDFLRRARVNLVGHTLPLNLKVILSPDVGVPNPAAWARFEANRSANMALAMEKSQELRHLVYSMDRDYNDAIRKAIVNAATGDTAALQKKAIEWGYKPIAKISQEFRASTFIDTYNKALERGLSDHDAILVADSTMRERHGAASVADLPAALQSSEGMKMLTIFQGYFNTMYNWQRQMPGNVRRGEWGSFLENGLGTTIVGATFGAALFNQQKKDDSWFKTIAKALLIQPMSTVPILNSVASFVFEGFSPRMPYASLLTALSQVKSDAVKVSKGERPEKPITHAFNVIGLASGLPLAQIGRTTQFSYDVAKGYQRPRNIGEWARGIITGEARLK